MQLNLLLLPLLGGFLFLSTCKKTAYFLARQTASTFSYWLAVTGLILLVISRVATVAWSAFDETPEIIAISLIHFFVIPLTVALALSLAGLAAIELVALGMAIKKRKVGSTGGIKTVLFEHFRKSSKLAELFFGVVFACGSAFALVQVQHSISVLDPHLFGIPVVAIWIIELVPYVVICSAWAKQIKAFPPTTLFRVTIVCLFFTLSMCNLAFHPDQVEKVWVSLASPITKAVDPDEFMASCLALVLGPLFGHSMNIIYPLRGVRISLMRSRTTNSLERLFFSVTNRAKMIMLTLSDGKVYCGYINWIPPDPGATDSYLEVRPVLSGYREKDNRTVHLPVNYAPFYTKESKFYVQGLKDNWAQFIKVIPIAMITAAGEFDADYFDEFKKQPSLEKAESVPPASKIEQWAPLLTAVTQMVETIYALKRRRKD